METRPQRRGEKLVAGALFMGVETRAMMVSSCTSCQARCLLRRGGLMLCKDDRWLAFIGKKRKLSPQDERNYSKNFVCSVHFSRDDYDSSQASMYGNKLRTKTPTLKPEAVPSQDTAEHQFPPSFRCAAHIHLSSVNFCIILYRT